MGIIRAEFRFEQALPSTPEVVAWLGESGCPAEVIARPAGYHVVVDDLSVAVVDHGLGPTGEHELEVAVQGLGRLTQGILGRARWVRRALAALGGVERSVENDRVRFGFERAPTPRDVAVAVARLQGRRVQEVFPWDASEDLVFSPGGTATLRREDDGALVVEAMLGDGAAHQLACAALEALGGMRRRG